MPSSSLSTARLSSRRFRGPLTSMPSAPLPLTRLPTGCRTLALSKRSGNNSGSQSRPGGPIVDIHTEDDALQVLLDADIDKVMSGLDRIVEAAPSYEKL